jgi:hypothetical protein
MTEHIYHDQAHIPTHIRIFQTPIEDVVQVIIIISSSCITVRTYTSFLYTIIILRSSCITVQTYTRFYFFLDF